MTPRSRRALCIGICDFGPHEAEPATDAPATLSFAVDRADQVRRSLDLFGYRGTRADGKELPTTERLGRAVTDELKQHGGGDVVVIHVLSHGVLGLSGLYVVGADGQNTDVQDWLKFLDDFPDLRPSRPTTLFLLDTCHAGAAARLDWLRAAEHNSRAWVIAATSGADLAYDGVFSRAVAEVLTDIASGAIDLYPSEYVRFSDLVEQIRTRVAQLGGRRQDVTGTPVDGNAAPPFVPNPRKPRDARLARTVRDSDETLRPFLDLDHIVDVVHFADRAAGRMLGPGMLRGRVQGCFTGRTEQLTDISRWLADGTEPLRVVTGGAGSGKSAVLGVVVCAAHPGLREATTRLWDTVPAEALPAPVTRLAAVHLRERDLGEALLGLSRQLGLAGRPGIGEPAGDSGPAADIDAFTAAVITAISALPDPPVVVLDALDEAIGQQAIVDRLLLPLARSTRTDGRPACRLLVGTRPWDQFLPLLNLARRRGRLVDLDDLPAEVLRGDVAAYVVDLLAVDSAFDLGARRRIGRGVAQALTDPGRERGGEFLAASLYANWLRDAHPQGADSQAVDTLLARVPTAIPDLLDLDLSTERAAATETDRTAAGWLRPVLAAIAATHGEGMPATVIRRLAPVLRAASEESISDDDDSELSPDLLSRVITRIRFYLRSSPDIDGTTLYRIFHQGLVDHLQPDDSLLSPLYDALVRPTSEAPAGRRDFDRAEPYAARHWDEHAVNAGRLDELLEVDPDVMRTLCNTARSRPGRLAAAIWRLSDRVTPLPTATRTELLTIDALRYGAPKIAARVWARRPARPGRTRAVGNGPAQPYNDPARSDEQPAWGDDSPVWPFELTPVWSTGSELPSPEQLAMFVGYYDWINAVACTVLDGRPIAVTGGGNRTVRVWDLATGRPVGDPMKGHTKWINAVACTVLDGRPIAVTGSDDKTVRIWDLDTRRQIGRPMVGHVDWINAVACTVLDGRPIAVTGGNDKTIRVWDLATCQPIGGPMTGHQTRITALACTFVDGRPIAVSNGNDAEVLTWDLAARRQFGEPLVSGYPGIDAVDCATISGVPSVVAAGRMLRRYALSSAEHVVSTVSNQDIGARALVCAVLNGRPVAIVGGERTIEVFDLVTGAQVRGPFSGHTQAVRAVAHVSLRDRPVAVSVGDDNSVRTWDLAPVEQIGAPIVGHRFPIKALEYAVLEGRRVAMTLGARGRPRAWDLASGRQVTEFLPEIPQGTSGEKVIDGLTVGDRLVIVFASEPDTLQVAGFSGKTIEFRADTRFGIVSTVAVGATRGRTIIIVASSAYSSDPQPTHVLQAWDMSSQRSLWTCDPQDPVTAMTCGTVHGEAVVITCSPLHGIRTWSIESGDEIGQSFTGRLGEMSRIEFVSLHDRETVVTVAGGERSARVWDLSTRTIHSEPLIGHTSPITALKCAVIADRTIAITGSDDQTVRIWDLATYRELSQMHFPDGIGALSVTDDGTVLVGYGWEVACLRLTTPTG
ncbi:WD40 repeat protein [Catenulispora sp. GAS73]|uniref:hypothetical protein n=1 Tax=Catenulispora sp. GAS73 TaxID=3156269 RepID=UPI0035139C99